MKFFEYLLLLLPCGQTQAVVHIIENHFKLWSINLKWRTERKFIKLPSTARVESLSCLFREIKFHSGVMQLNISAENALRVWKNIYEGYYMLKKGKLLWWSVKGEMIFVKRSLSRIWALFLKNFPKKYFADFEI